MALNKCNWDWLFQHFQALCTEYTFRYNKKHKSESLLLTLLQYNQCIPKDKTVTSFPNCTKFQALQVDFTNIDNIHDAYQQYLVAKWSYNKIRPRWTNRSTPSWFFML